MLMFFVVLVVVVLMAFVMAVALVTAAKMAQAADRRAEQTRCPDTFPAEWVSAGSES